MYADVFSNSGLRNIRYEQSERSIDILIFFFLYFQTSTRM